MNMISNIIGSAVRIIAVSAIVYYVYPKVIKKIDELENKRGR
jgi:hypothetical protein